MHKKCLSENLKGRGRGENLGVDGGTESEWILGKHDGKMLTGCIESR